MPLDGLTTGIDNTLIFVNPDGSVINISGIESFTSMEDATITKEILMNGSTKHPKFHQGWSGSFVVQRMNNVLDNYFAVQEAQYNLGADQIDVFINQTITESDGTQSQYQYYSVVLKLENAGDYSGTAIVKQTISFMCGGRQQIF